MKRRVMTSVVGLAVLAVAMISINTPIFNLFAMAFAIIAMQELCISFNCKSILLRFTLIVAAVFIAIYELLIAPASFLPFAFLFVILLALSVLHIVKTHSLHNQGIMMLYGVVVLFCCYCYFQFSTVEASAVDKVYLFLFCSAIAWGGDVFAFLFGSKFGKAKLIPDISPNKTIVGAIAAPFGSASFVIVMTLVFYALCNVFGAPSQVDLSMGFLFKLIITAGIGSFVGILGDLLASAVKREGNIKDFGKLFPGHGGLLDRFDSVLLLAPFVVIISTQILYN